jgi:hypothetical protein
MTIPSVEPDILGMFEQLAEVGTAPQEGCSLFGVGYGDAFDRLHQKYIVERFSRGGSAEKFVTGPFGSGKTHFLRQMMEIARGEECVTAEVALSKDIDFTNSLLVYQEITREIRAPGQDAHGLRPLLSACVDIVKQRAGEVGAPPDDVATAWAGGLAEANLELDAFGRVARRTILSRIQGDEDGFELGCRWLGGDVGDRPLARQLGESVFTAAEQRVFSRRARLSLFQLIRHAGFRGTVVGFDEAEQGISVEKNRMAKVFSHLLSEINALVDLQRGAALVVYAVTPDVIDKIGERLPALAQRIADPGPNQGFFDGVTTAPRIDLTRRDDPERELEQIGRRLCALFFDRVPGAPKGQRSKITSEMAHVARDVSAGEPSSSARRSMVKRVASQLLQTLNAEDRGSVSTVAPEKEV